MIHLFFEDNNLYIRSGIYDKDSLPPGVLIFEGNLPECKEPNKLVYRNGKVEVLSPLEWTKHRIAVKDLVVQESQRIDSDGNIVNKSIFEILEDAPRQDAFKFLYNGISKQAGIEITSGFMSCALGYPCRYDSSLNDQFNLKTKYDSDIGSDLRCLNSISGIKTFFFHDRKQVQIVYYDFIKHRDEFLKRADEEKINLKKLFDSEKSVKEILLEVKVE
jgi:hypothetical protein